MDFFGSNRELSEKIDEFISDLEIVVSGMHNEIQTSKSELNQYLDKLKSVTTKYTNDGNVRKINLFLDNHDELRSKISQIFKKIATIEKEISMLSEMQEEQYNLYILNNRIDEFETNIQSKINDKLAIEKEILQYENDSNRILSKIEELNI